MKATQLSTEENMINSNVRRTPLVTAWMASGLASLIMTMSALGQLSITQPAGITLSSDAGASTSNPQPASPYPSAIGPLKDVLGEIEKVTVTLTGLTHNYPVGLNVVLVSPAGKQVLLMSHAGGAGSLNGVNLTFDDSASSFLPPASPNSQIVSGTYKPTGNTSAYAPSITSIPSPPSGTTLTGSIGTSLGAYQDDDPNGTWKLFVFDDAALDSGSLVSWTLNLFTTPTVTATTPSGTATNRFATMENTSLTVNLTLKSSTAPLNSRTVSAVCADKTLVSDTNIVAGGSGGARTLQITPNLNKFGTNTIEVTVKDGDLGSTVTNLFTLEVKFVNQPPTISLATNKVTTVAGVLTTNVPVTLADVDSPTSLTLSAVSSNPSAVAGTDVFFTGTGLTRQMWIAPNGAGTGTATLTIPVVDPLEPTRLLTNSTTIDVTVIPVKYAVFANPSSIVLNDDAAGSPYPSTVAVSGVSGLIGRVTVV